VKVHSLDDYLPVDVCPSLAILGQASLLPDRLQLSMDCIPELADRIFSQESEVPIQKSGESAEMPLAWILDGKILGAR
jgi:hypothetical protein